MGNVDTMHYLFAAYSAIWIILAIYLYSIQSREKKLRDELSNLRELIEHRPESRKKA